MQNPFRFGRVVTGEHFTDRAAELASLLSDMRSGQDVVVISPRRFGKTSLIERALDQGREEGMLAGSVDLLACPTKERFVALLAGTLSRHIASPLTRVGHGARDAIMRLHPGLRVGGGTDGVEWTFSPSVAHRDTDAALERLLAYPEEVAQKRKRRVVLVFDEFQAALDIDPDLPSVLRATFQHQQNVSHVFLGSRQHLMRRTFADRGQPMYRMARPLNLGPLPHGDLADFVRARFAATGMVIEDDAVDALLAQTECLPYETQQLASVAWEIASHQGVDVTMAAIGTAWNQMLDAESTRCIDLWTGLSPRQRSVLLAIGIGVGRGLYADRTRSELGLGPVSSVRSSLRQLVQRDIVCEEVQAHSPSSYSVPDPVLRAWLVRLSRQ